MNMMAKAKQLLDYLAMHPDAIIWLQASDMILNVHSDVSYLSETKAAISSWDDPPRTGTQSN